MSSEPVKRNCWRPEIARFGPGTHIGMFSVACKGVPADLDWFEYHARDKG
jgi:hypothetical protein